MAISASRIKNVVRMLVPIIGGVFILAVVAVFSQSIATALALAAIGIGSVSMLLAITRKH